MANQIVMLFSTSPHDQAVAATADHLRKFWDPRMRRQILEHIQSTGGEGLSVIALAATRSLGENAVNQGKPAALGPRDLARSQAGLSYHDLRARLEIEVAVLAGS
jgi:formate dehydrogenase subunit delta